MWVPELIFLYITVGVICAFLLVSESKRSDLVHPAEPTFFWLYLILWPMTLLIRVVGKRSVSEKVCFQKGVHQKLEAALGEYQQSVISAAESKLGRSLSEAERLGVERTSSLLILESCQRAFSSDSYSSSQIEEDLSHLSKNDAARQNA